MTAFGVCSFIYFLLYEKLVTILPLIIIFVWLISRFNSPLSNLQIILIVLTIVLAILFYPFFVLKWEKPNYWILGSITVMLFCLVFGLMLISSLYGYTPAKFDVHSKEGNLSVVFKTHELSCATFNDKIYADSNATCSFDNNDLSINSAKIISVDYLGKAHDINLSNMTFVVPENVSLVFFELNSSYQNQTLMLESTPKLYTFYNYDISREREQNFALYLIALIGIIAFSIPAMLNSFKNLSR